MFPPVSIDAGGLGGVIGGRSTSSYVDNSFAVSNSFRILALSLSKKTVATIRIDVNTLTKSKATVRTDAVTATSLPLETAMKYIMFLFYNKTFNYDNYHHHTLEL